jgi:plastocyanin
MKPFLAFAALALAAPLSAQPGAPTYPVQLYSFGFNPTPMTLRAGQPVTLVFTNASGTGHEFKAPAFFRASKIVSGSVSGEGSVELKGHRSASVTLIPARGTYQAHCGHFMHAQMGMTTTIEVR